MRPAAGIQSLSQWLEQFDFNDDPFGVYEAEREQQVLPAFWVRRAYLNDLVGRPAHPETAFLLAGRGAGKTATREMVAYECRRGGRWGRALPVHYHDFHTLLEAVNFDPARVTAREHVRYIVRLALASLVTEAPSAHFKWLRQPEREILAALAAAFADSLTRTRLDAALLTPPATVNWDDYSPREILERLSEAVTHIGRTEGEQYRAVYVLVDGSDETEAGPDAAVPLLRTLACNGPLLQTPHVAFKFFVPVGVGDALVAEGHLRTDRMCQRRIEWDDGALRDLIAHRLAYYSDERVQRFEELCTAGARADTLERLITAAGRSPRRLLQLCESLVHAHLRRGSDSPFLDTKDASEVLQHAAETSSEPQAAIERPGSIDQQKQGLFMDESGHVWVDGREITAPIPPLEFRLLWTLYRESPVVLSPDSLIEHVWLPVDSGAQDAANETNLRRLINRLRKRLEPDAVKGESRFIRNARGRGYYLVAD